MNIIISNALLLAILLLISTAANAWLWLYSPSIAGLSLHYLAYTTLWFITTYNALLPDSITVAYDPVFHPSAYVVAFIFNSLLWAVVIFGIISIFKKTIRKLKKLKGSEYN